MMNIPPGEARNLSLWDYEALLWHWNEAHSTDGPIGTLDGEEMQAMLDRINADPRLTGAVPADETVN